MALFETPAGFALFEMLIEGKLDASEVSVQVWKLVFELGLVSFGRGFWLMGLLIGVLGLGLQELYKEFETAEAARKVCWDGDLMSVCLWVL